MINRQLFWQITAADFIARAAYQMGKTPLLPIFAATLGATDLYLGLIVSVSTLTGMVFKPFVGLLSDRTGRRLWLLIGTAFFVFMPFVYRWVDTPTQLFIVRIIHGTATAIYGPVTIAYVAELKSENTAERLGWFGWARSGGYIIGPALAGWLLLSLDPATIFTIMGLFSSIAFIPVWCLKETTSTYEHTHQPWKEQLTQAWHSSRKAKSIWIAGGLEGSIFVALYAIKAFLPIYALSAGFNTAVVGLFFSIQEAIHLLGKPLGGRIGDRWGYKPTIVIGMIIIGGTLPLLHLLDNNSTLFTSAVIFGIGQALIFPNTIALIVQEVDRQHLGSGIGFLGTLQNGGKVIGPVLGGILITQFSYGQANLLFGLLLISSAIVWWLYKPNKQVQYSSNMKSAPKGGD